MWGLPAAMRPGPLKSGPGVGGRAARIGRAAPRVEDILQNWQAIAKEGRERHYFPVVGQRGNQTRWAGSRTAGGQPRSYRPPWIGKRGTVACAAQRWSSHEETINRECHASR